MLNNLLADIKAVKNKKDYGVVTAVRGLLIEIAGFHSDVSVGDICNIMTREGKNIPSEVVGFAEGKVLLMPFLALEGVGPDCRVEVSGSHQVLYPHESWLGRVINAFGEPVDGKGPLVKGKRPCLIHCSPPPANLRARVAGKVDLGVRAINTFLTVCRGQRMGIFAGSGVGKSSLISMMAKHTNADVNVLGLIGERGREAREFIEDDLGEEGMKRSVVVIATSDESPLMRRQSAYVAMTIAEFFRDEGKNVLCMMDSITRFAMAQREISLSVGEPPASKGYTPSVFAELPRLLERAGPGKEGSGAITGLFTVLVEGDDHNEPIADAVRGILDGHIVLDRLIAERGRFPAINILRSISRTMPMCNNDKENLLVSTARGVLSTYENMAELIRLGAYRKGSNKDVDIAMDYYPLLEKFIAQGKKESFSLAEGYEQLSHILAPLLENADYSFDKGEDNIKQVSKNNSAKDNALSEKQAKNV